MLICPQLLPIIFFIEQGSQPPHCVIPSCTKTCLRCSHTKLTIKICRTVIVTHQNLFWWTGELSLERAASHWTYMTSDMIYVTKLTRIESKKSVLISCFEPIRRIPNMSRIASSLVLLVKCAPSLRVRTCACWFPILGVCVIDWLKTWMSSF